MLLMLRCERPRVRTTRERGLAVPAAPDQARISAALPPHPPQRRRAREFGRKKDDEEMRRQAMIDPYAKSLLNFYVKSSGSMLK